MAQQLRLVIADDESLIRMNLKETLVGLGYLVVGEAGDGVSVVNLAREHGWVNDGINLRTELGREFSLVADGTPALEHTSHIAATSSFWATFTPS